MLSEIQKKDVRKMTEEMLSTILDMTEDQFFDWLNDAADNDIQEFLDMLEPSGVKDIQISEEQLNVSYENLMRRVAEVSTA